MYLPLTHSPYKDWSAPQIQSALFIVATLAKILTSLNSIPPSSIGLAICIQLTPFLPSQRNLALV